MEMDTERDYSTVVEQLSPPPLEVNEEEPFATATQAKSTQAESTNAQPSGNLFQLQVHTYNLTVTLTA